MLKRLMMAACVLGLAVSLGCSSKKKAEDSVAAGNAGMDPSVSSKDIAYDALGSDSGRIDGLVTVNFDYDASTLTQDSKQKLSANAEWIKKNSSVTVQVEGHCDSRGSVEYNLALGERRAKAVKNYLVSLGVDPKRLTIISYGKEKPIMSGENEEAYAKNRRANFVPLPN